MQKVPNRFGKTVVVLVDGDELEKSSLVANTMCSTMAEDNYITDLHSIESPCKTFASILGWNGVDDTRGKLFLRGLDKLVRDYNHTFWINLLLESLEEKPNYPYDIIFIYGNTTTVEKNFIQADPIYRVVTVYIGEHEGNKLEFESGDYNYTLKSSDKYSEILKNCRTILDNILNNFSTPVEVKHK